ncbi:thioredoxin [Spiroplasma helicoides]|uniref:Thioredoxin n=1 Tax=Spiroplasma helicoides TaxID=216938 RepID=A0A1B3SJJ4_9MOLU|nr:thioredoxin [Spiroplasma helicoides]AOG60091.1 thioredoxin [Spiroplasma helicoides]
MAKVVTTIEEFKAEIGKENTVVDFFAEWCGPCKMFAPLFDQVAESEKDANFIKVDIDQLREAADEYGIQSIPTVLKFKSGEEVNRHVGSLGKDDLVKFAK